MNRRSMSVLVGSFEPCQQPRKPLLRPVVPHGHCQRLPPADDLRQPFAPCAARVSEERELAHTLLAAVGIRQEALFGFRARDVRRKQNASGEPSCLCNLPEHFFEYPGHRCQLCLGRLRNRCDRCKTVSRPVHTHNQSLTKQPVPRQVTTLPLVPPTRAR